MSEFDDLVAELALAEQRLARSNAPAWWSHMVASRLVPTDRVVIVATPSSTLGTPWTPRPTYGRTLIHPDTLRSLRSEMDSLSGHADWFGETKLRSLERMRWADDGGPTR